MPVPISKPRQSSQPRGMKRVDLGNIEIASSEAARSINRDTVLEIIRLRQPISRADLARASGMQPSTISAIVEQLMDEQWIIEGATARLPRGRRPTLLSFNDQLVIIGVDVRPRHAVVALVDLNGRFLARESVPILSSAERSVERIIEAMRTIRTHYPDRIFKGVGISLPGRIDPASERLVFAPNLKWTDYDLKGAVEEAMSLPVALENAANACLLSELWFGHMHGVREAVLVTLFEGLGTAILANGQLVMGRGGLAGEFGHSPIDPSGPLCNCGQRGCWEVFASSSAALRYYTELSPDHRHVAIAELLGRAEEGEEHAIAAITRQAEAVGRGLRLITTSLSPELILITGDLTTSWSRFGPIIQEQLAASMLVGAPPRLAITPDGELSRLRGSTAVVLQRQFGHHAAAVPAAKEA